MEAIEIIGWIARCMTYIGIKEIAVYELSTHSIASRSAEELANLFQQLLILNSERASTTVCSPMSSYDITTTFTQHYIDLFRLARIFSSVVEEVIELVSTMIKCALKDFIRRRPETMSVSRCNVQTFRRLPKQLAQGELYLVWFAIILERDDCVLSIDQNQCS